MKHAIINGKENKYYYVDKLGRIFNKNGHEMKQHESYNGYLRVKLSVGVKRGMYLVHRIVAETFIANPKQFPIVNHLDSNRSNNNVLNLEWTDNSGNQLQRYRKNGHKGTKRRPVYQMDKVTYEILRIWESPIDAEKALGIAHQNIYIKYVKGCAKLLAASIGDTLANQLTNYHMS